MLECKPLAPKPVIVSFEPRCFHFAARRLHRAPRNKNSSTVAKIPNDLTGVEVRFFCVESVYRLSIQVFSQKCCCSAGYVCAETRGFDHRAKAEFPLNAHCAVPGQGWAKTG